MGISAALLAVLTAIVVAVSVWVLASPTGQSMIRDYMDLITSDTRWKPASLANTANARAGDPILSRMGTRIREPEMAGEARSQSSTHSASLAAVSVATDLREPVHFGGLSNQRLYRCIGNLATR